MILHTAALSACLIDQVQSSPIVVQLVQKSEPESWHKWLLPTIIQTVVSLGSIASGVCIAWWSFNRSARTEHEQWVRDQRKAEWRELLTGLCRVGKDYLPQFKDEVTVKRFIDRAQFMEDETLEIFLQLVFIAQGIADEYLDVRKDQFLLNVKNQTASMEFSIESKHQRFEAVNNYQSLRQDFHDLIGAVRRAAERDAGVNTHAQQETRSF